MAKPNLVRPSRDGDQFHYLWAARRCLHLLSPNTDFVAISIEGASPEELSGNSQVYAGEDLLDIAEYYGDENLEQAKLVKYVQLKHSTKRLNEPWTANGLEKTIKGFAKRFSEIQGRLISSKGKNDIEFWFVTNRPISPNIVQSVEDAAKKSSPRHPKEYKKLQDFTKLTGEDFSVFFQCFHFDDSQKGYWDQRNILFQELAGYLPGSDTDAPVQLKELVTRRALSESEDNPTITKIDVLRVLQTNESKLFPSPCLIKQEENPVAREQETEIIKSIVEGNGPFLIYADGGVGKSIFATRIQELLPRNSVSILYDCFGNGQYRSASGYRHRHKDALVQIANELATIGLCHPLIPSTHADTGDYIRAFIYRLGQAIKILRSKEPDAILAVVIDAADNSQMAAIEIGEKKSFAPDLIRENVPEGIRLIFLCRPYRQELLDPPTHTNSIELKPFSLSETKVFLSQKFPEANSFDITEFHRLSSHNPRVQALALSQNLDLSETLRLLGPNPTTVEDTIADLLNKAIEKLKCESGNIERERIDRICICLAALRPLIPISVLSAISGIQESAIKSFAYDIGRPLLVTGEMIQFLDEPAESWFRKKFKPTTTAMKDFINILRPLAQGSVYISSILPHLMLEAGEFSELVELALSSDSLPEANILERRDIELQRLQFAFKASLRNKHYLNATKLSLKAGGESATEDRQANLLQNNTDLASEFLSVQYIQDTVSRQIFSSIWVGSHHVYEASLLSGKKELSGDARSRLRMAHEWLHNLMKIKSEDQEGEHVSDDDIVELTLTHLNIHGPEVAANYLRTWSPREVSYRVGRSLTRLLIDHSRWTDIADLAIEAGNNLYLTMAITAELGVVKKLPPFAVCREAIRLIKRNLIRYRPDYSTIKEGFPLEAVLGLIEACIRYNLLPLANAAKILQDYIPTTPPRSLSSRHDSARFNLLKAYCLIAAIENKEIELKDLAYDDVKKELEKAINHSESRELRELKEVVGALLPWQKLWASELINQFSRVEQESIEKCLKASNVYQSDYAESASIINEIALIWMELLQVKQGIFEDEIKQFCNWKESQNRPFFTRTLNALSRLCGQTEMTKHLAFTYASESYNLIINEKVEADTKTGDIMEIARSVLGSSKSEAKTYFDQAMKVAGKLGTENFARWGGIVEIAKNAAAVGNVEPQLVFQFARCGELSQDYIGERYFDWEGTIAAITKLSPMSALPILSRWRDRKFGNFKENLPNAFNILIESKKITPQDALPFLAFRENWDVPRIIKLSLETGITHADKNLIVGSISKYLSFMDFSLSDLKTLKEIELVNQIELIPFLSERIERLETSVNSSQNEHFVATNTIKPEVELEKPLDWNEIFFDIDLETSDGIAKAYKRYKDKPRSYYPEVFFKEAIQRAPVGKEPSFIYAITHFPDFHYAHLDTILKSIPIKWLGRLAVKEALSESTKSVIKRNFTNFSKSRFHGTFPLEQIKSITDVSESEIINIVLSAYGETSDQIETSNLFSVVGLLSTVLNSSEALNVLGFALNLYEPVLEETDGDGPWDEKFQPPSCIEKALAGYIWSALGAPEATCRWEAAHAVLEFCKLGSDSVIEHLISMPQNKTGSPYSDAKLEFYYFHAFQWLLIGFHRASLSSPYSIAKYGHKFLEWALVNQPHVLIRQFSAQIALNLHSSSLFVLDEKVAEKLRNINKSTLPKLYSKSYNRAEEQGRRKLTGENEDIYYFGIDFGPYWLRPLGNVFALSESEIAAETINVIKNRLSINGKSTWRDDERAKRNLYQDRETWHSHGGSPRSDNLQFYHSYHAMMIVAGELLNRSSVHSDPDPEYQERDEFKEWLSRHELSRSDGRWLWDRRDPEPVTTGEWLSRKKDHPNFKTLMDQDFINSWVLTEQLILWGNWTEADSSRSQTYHISSALVNIEKSDALLAALSTTTDPNDYYIQSASSDRDIASFGFELTGWIANSGGSKNIDEYDPWAGDVSFSASRPADFIIQSMHIVPDQDFRFWNDESNNVVIETQLWGEFDEGHQNSRTNPNCGDRLLVTPSFIKSVLKKLNLNLIVEVQIERHKRHRSYDRDDKNDDESIRKTSKIFLLDSDGKIRYQ